MITGKFKNGSLKVEELNVIKITKTIRTPFYVYSKKYSAKLQKFLWNF